MIKALRITRDFNATLLLLLDAGNSTAQKKSVHMRQTAYEPNTTAENTTEDRRRIQTKKSDV